MDLMEKTLKSEKKFSGNIFDVYVETVELPNGEISTRDVIKHHGAVVLVPVTKDGEMILVRQYRQSIRDIILELPAGRLEEGEEPEEAAYRELQEETGYIADKLVPFGVFHPAVGYSSEKIHVFLAEGLEKRVEQDLDDDEFINIEKYKLEDLKTMALNDEILDSKTMSYVLKYVLLNEK